MNSGDKVVFLERGNVAMRQSEHLDRLSQSASERLQKTLAAALDQVDDALFDRAERAVSNTDQERYFVGMRQVRLNRRSIDERFREGFRQGFADLSRLRQRPASQATETGARGLELMDEAAVEEDVAIDSAVGRLRTRLAFPLRQLSVRLDHLLGGGIDDDTNPLDPKAMIAAFANGIAALEIEIQPRIILYKLFEKQLLRTLPGLYEEANRILIEAGVLPDMKGTEPPARSAGGRPRGVPGGATSTPAAPSAYAEALPPDGEAVVRTLHDLLDGLHRAADQGGYGGGYGHGYYTGAPAGAAPVAELSSVLHALSGLQRTSSPETGAALDGAQLKALLSDALSQREGEVRFERSTGDTIDIVSMLFDVILNDDRLHGSIRALIARLQIPVVKVALVDHQILASRQHPARQLLNELAHAAIGWNEPAEPARDPLYARMSEVVDRVVETFAEDVRVFEKALYDFRDYLERERRRASAVEERTREAAEGQARVDAAKQRVRREIDARLEARQVPDVVRRLVEEAWYKVLFISAVKEGEDGPTWQHNVAVMDRLVWSVEPKPGGAERQRMLAEMPALLRELRTGLNGIMFDPRDMSQLFRDLETEHLKCIALGEESAAEGSPTTASGEPDAAAGDAGDTPFEMPPLVSSNVSRDGEPRSALPAASAGGRDALPSDAAKDEFPAEAERLQAVALGSWFELAGEGGEPLRGKLSARLNGGQRFVFVDRSGFKLADRSLHSLCRDLDAERLAILDDDILFDRALQNVISNLREMRASQSL